MFAKAVQRMGTRVQAAALDFSDILPSEARRQLSREKKQPSFSRLVLTVRALNATGHSRATLSP